MNNISDVGTYFTSKQFLSSVVVVCITLILLVIIKKYLIKKVAYTTKDEQHKNTFVGVIFNVLQYVVVLGCVVIVMQLHGVNVTSIIAGLGIVGALVGLALQDTMKDVISGISIYNNNFYKVGDLVMYNGEMCEVKYFSARVTKFVSLLSNNTFTVCNSTITSVEKVKDGYPIRLTFDFDTNREKIEKCFAKAGESIKDETYLKDIEYYGLIDITDNGVVYMSRIIAPGHKAYDIKLKYLSTLYDELRKAKLSPSFSDEVKVKKVN